MRLYIYIYIYIYLYIRGACARRKVGKLSLLSKAQSQSKIEMSESRRLTLAAYPRKLTLTASPPGNIFFFSYRTPSLLGIRIYPPLGSYRNLDPTQRSLAFGDRRASYLIQSFDPRRAFQPQRGRLTSQAFKRALLIEDQKHAS